MALHQSRRGRRNLITAVMTAAIIVGATGCVLPVHLPFLPGGEPSQPSGEPSYATMPSDGPMSRTIPGQPIPEPAGPTSQVTTVTVTVQPVPVPVPEPTNAQPPKPACPAGISPPAGVRAMVCGGVPTNAKDAPATAKDGIYSFATPSRNIGCDWVSGLGSADGVECAIVEATFKQPTMPKSCDLSWEGHQVSIGSKAYRGICRGDMMNALYLLQTGKKMPSLAYGHTIAHASWACSSAETGLTCWNTKNHHGFTLSRTVLATW